jgi:chromosome segregation ATPase
MARKMLAEHENAMNISVARQKRLLDLMEQLQPNITRSAATIETLNTKLNAALKKNQEQTAQPTQTETHNSDTTTLQENIARLHAEKTALESAKAAGDLHAKTAELQHVANTRKIVDLEANIAALTDQLKKVQEAADRATEEKNARETQFQNEKAEDSNEHNNVQSTVESLRQVIARLEEAKTSLEAEMSQLRQAHSTLTQEITQQNKTVAEKDVANKLLQEEILTRDQAMKGLEEKLEQGSSTATEQQNVSLHAQITTLTIELSDAVASKDSQEAILTHTKEDLAQVQHDFARLEDVIRDLKTTITREHEKTEQLEADERTLDGEVQTLKVQQQAEVQILKDKNVTVQNELHACRIKNDDLEATSVREETTQAEERANWRRTTEEFANTVADLKKNVAQLKAECEDDKQKISKDTHIVLDCAQTTIDKLTKELRDAEHHLALARQEAEAQIKTLRDEASRTSDFVNMFDLGPDTDEQKAQKVFDKYDMDKDGSLSRWEGWQMTIDLLRSYQQGNAPSEEDVVAIRRFWKSMDTDSSGNVNYTEFERWYVDVIQHYRVATNNGRKTADAGVLTAKANEENDKTGAAAARHTASGDDLRFTRDQLQQSSRRIGHTHPQFFAKMSNPYCI